MLVTEPPARGDHPVTHPPRRVAGSRHLTCEVNAANHREPADDPALAAHGKGVFVVEARKTDPNGDGLIWKLVMSHRHESTWEAFRLGREDGPEREV